MFGRDEEYEQRIATLERELAEARVRWQQTSAWHECQRAEAAEARLAAVAQACDVWYVVVVDDEQVKYVERARVLAALSAPAETKPVSTMTDDEYCALRGVDP